MDLSLWPQVRLKELLKFLMPTHKTMGHLFQVTGKLLQLIK